jgi:5-methylcytosine-specific restriction endonuclease McrA
MSASPLDASVLVLNREFVALNVTSAKRAFCLLCKALAEVVAVEDGEFELHDFSSWREASELKLRSGQADRRHSGWVRTVSFEIEVPKIVRLQFYGRYPDRVAKFNRRNIFARDRRRCQYCGKRFPMPELSIDHVVPRSQGGRSTWTNVVCACVACNKAKGGQTPEQAGMRLIRPAKAPRQNPMIALKLRNKRYHTWRHFLDDAYWNVALEA